MKSRLVLLFIFSSLLTKAQITQINPAIGWNYVKTQELDLTDELWYNTDFAAESGFDYIFVMNHTLSSIQAAIQVFDMQDGFIGSNNNDTSSKVIDLPFDVKESGVYRVFFLVNDKLEGSSTHKVQLTLIRRKKL